jgi:hypothetical protein
VVGEAEICICRLAVSTVSMVENEIGDAIAVSAIMLPHQ